MAAGRGDLGRRRRQAAPGPVGIVPRVVAFLVLLAPLAAAAQDELRGYRDAIGRGDYNAAAAELRPLADAGNAEAQYRLAMQYADGLGLRSNDAIAASWLLRAADQGHPRAQVSLGHLYKAGRGVPADAAMALRWYRKAADAGDAEAQRLIRQMSSGKQQ